MARLKSVAKANLLLGNNNIYTVSNDITQVKLSEIIIANKDESNSVNLSMKIYKQDINSEIIIIPFLKILENESRFISLSTILSTGDKLIINSSENNKLDVFVSFIEV